MVMDRLWPQMAAGAKRTMPFQKPKAPEELSDEALAKRLHIAGSHPGKLATLYNVGVKVAAIAGIIGAVFLASALGLGGGGEIALLLLLSGGMIAARALTQTRIDSLEREERVLQVEQADRPGRMQRLAKSLKESFIHAMTGGTKEDMTVKGPLKLKTAPPRENKP